MKRKSKSRRGGFLGSLINQAIVPFSILALQQTYKKKKHGGGKRSRKHHGGRRSRAHR
jgi:hypothetical protein